MDRREFLKVTGAGALTLFLSGCGINAVRGDKKAGAAPAAGNAEAKPGSVSNGKPLKIVVLCGSPHRNSPSPAGHRPVCQFSCELRYPLRPSV